MRALKQSGARLFLWSTAGAEYARSTAGELGLVECFEGFLPKPSAVVDGQPIAEGRDFLQFLPGQEVTLSMRSIFLWSTFWSRREFVASSGYGSWDESVQ